MRGPGTSVSYQGVQDDKADLVARRRNPGCSPPPGIARRIWLRRRLASGDHELDDLAQGKIPDHVKTMRKGKLERLGGSGGVGHVGIYRSLKISPAAMAAARARLGAARRLLC